MDGDTAMPSIRVLVAHDFYRRRGGEDTVVEREQALLRAHGHEVCLFAADNATIRGPLAKARAAWNATEAPDARRRLGVAIADFRPNVVHVHNFFPLLSPSLYDACAASDVAVVQTLHNYRTICPGALLWRDRNEMLPFSRPPTGYIFEFSICPRPLLFSKLKLKLFPQHISLRSQGKGNSVSGGRDNNLFHSSSPRCRASSSINTGMSSTMG